LIRHSWCSDQEEVEQVEAIWSTGGDANAKPIGGGWLSPAETPIYVVDDEETTLHAVVQYLLGQSFDVKGFLDPIEAAEAIRSSSPHLLITDRNMPGLGGFDLARIALEEDPDIAVVILTGARDVELAVQAFRLGAVDYLLKPLDLEAIGDTVGRTLFRRSQSIFHRGAQAEMREELEARARDVERGRDQLEAVTVRALSALIRILEARTPHFDGHSRAVAELSEKIARELGLSPNEVRQCKTAGFLHDIGMIAVPDKILEKASPLTSHESEQVQGHCGIGKEILEPFIHLGPVPEYVFRHHERVDGSGYPDGLKDEDIAVPAQVVGVAESFTALMETRAFRPAHSLPEALEILLGTAGIWHSQRVLEALARVHMSGG
jgi:putative two-component system response regulator